MKLTNTQKLIVHAVLMDYNIQASVFPYKNPVAMQDEGEAQKFSRILVGAQMAMSEFAEFMVDEEGELGDGAKLLIGNLLKRQEEGLSAVSEEAMKQGEKLPDEFYTQKDAVSELVKIFPVETEEQPRIITP